MEDTLLQGLTEAQREAVTTNAEPLCVMAGAGSGKTSVLTRRIAWRVAQGRADPHHVLAVTFTRKAARQIRGRLAALGVPGGVAADTLHGAAFAQLRQHASDRGHQPPVVIRSVARLLGPLISDVTGAHPSPRLVGRVTTEISRAKAGLVNPDEFLSRAGDGDAGARTIGAIYTRYQQELRRRGALDLDDLIAVCGELLRTDQEFAAAQRWRWRHLFVDEYQDINPAHARLIDGWLGQDLDLCVVGDPNQAIYGWNGADPTLLTSFASRYPTATVLRLESNFRSTPEILAVAGAVLPPGAPRPVVDQSSPRCGSGPVPTVRRFPTDDDEALAVSRRLRDLHAPGTAWSRLAVLARTNAQLDVVAHRLTRAGIPFHIRGGRPVSSLSAFRSLLPPRTDVDVRHLRTEAATMLATSPDAAERTELRMILDATDDYLAVDQRGTVAGFIEWAAAAPPADQRSTGDAVELASFHRAKGLEWSAVFVIGLEHGLVPLIGRGPADADQAEERRLLYVALTRASDELHCSWAGQRRMGSDLCDRTPSPWLAEIAAALDTLEGARRATDPRQGIRALREVLASAAR